MSSDAKRTDIQEAGIFLLAPKLRFPGFNEPWANDPLFKVLVEHKLKNTAGREVFSVSMGSGIVNQIEHLGRSFAASDTSHYSVGRCFDVVYTKSPLKAFPFGVVKQCKFDGEVALSPLYGVFTPISPHVGLMIESYFESPNRSQRFLSPLCQKGAKNTLQITNETFLSGRLPLPLASAEQQKIAACLTSLDDLIAAQARKVDALKAHKKGLMQELFPLEGETQPRLRFPEFKATAGWEVKKLEDLAQRGSGHTPSKGNPEYYGGGVKWISLADSKRLDAGLISTTEIEISAQGIKKSSAVLHAAGTVLISRDAGVGKSAVMAVPMAVSQHFIVWICHAHLLSNWFLYYLLQKMKPIFERIASGSTIKTIGLPFFKALHIAIPTLPEQQRIASCLISLDDHITAATQELDALKTHKKGLMQQLFPPEEALEA